MPTTANIVADRLGIGGLPTYQLQSGCAGAVQAIEVATSLLASGAYRNALVLAGDSCAKHFDLTADLEKLPPSELVNVVLFGDGMGAAVLSTETGRVALRRAETRFTGVGRSPGQVVEWFGRAERGSTRAAVAEDYKAVETYVPALAVEALNELLDDLGWADDDVDFLLPPQLSGRMTARISERLALLGAREVNRVDETGNCGNALLFFQLEHLMSQIEPDDRAVGIAVESSKWITGSVALEGL
jgi:3-oxoacyl-[acyl-carrier-protein] synthase-3